MDVWLNDHVMFFYCHWCKYPWFKKGHTPSKHNWSLLVAFGAVQQWLSTAQRCWYYWWRSEMTLQEAAAACGGRRGRFCSSSAETWKAFFCFFFWCCVAECAISQTQLRKKKTITPQPTVNGFSFCSCHSCNQFHRLLLIFQPAQTRCWLLGACFSYCSENILTLRVSPAGGSS